MRYTYKSLTDVGRVRSANEDNMGERQTPNGHLFVVCDGMGGHVGGATASAIAVNSIIEYFERETYDNIILAIDRALSFANEQIYASALSNPDLKGMGTTAVVLVVRGEECFIGHVGDSRIYLRSDRKLNRITKDHSFVQTLVDSGIIRDDQAENHPKKNQILQALGIASEVKGTVCQAPILPKAGDLFMLCSDGLNGMVTDRDLERIVQEDNLDVATINLITAANNAGGNDNITASLVLIEESVHSTSHFHHFNPKQHGNDVRSTQNFESAPVSPSKKKPFMWIAVGGGVIVLAVLAVLYFFTGTTTEGPKSVEPEVKYSLEQVTSGDDCVNFDEGDSVNVESSIDSTFRVTCGDVEKEITVKNSIIFKMTTVTKSDDTDDSEEATVEVIAAEPKALKKMSEAEIKKLKIGDEVKDRSGEFELFGYTISVVNSKVTKKNKQELSDGGPIKHTVAKNQGLQAIVDKYKAKCPKLDKQMIIDYNVNSKNFKGDKSKLEREELVLGWILEIPCD
jgi:serine/threonine protein phosphatase PrpC